MKHALSLEEELRHLARFMDSFEFNPRAQKDLGYSSYPNVWDFFAFTLIIAVLTAFAKAFGDIAYLPSSELRGIDLSISALPWVRFVQCGADVFGVAVFITGGVTGGDFGRA